MFCHCSDSYSTKYFPSYFSHFTLLFLFFSPFRKRAKKKTQENKYHTGPRPSDYGPVNHGSRLTTSAWTDLGPPRAVEAKVSCLDNQFLGGECHRDSGEGKERREKREFTDGVDIAPVGLDLGVLQGVAVDLAGAGQQEARTDSLGQAEHVEGAYHIGLVKSESRTKTQTQR